MQRTGPSLTGDTGALLVAVQRAPGNQGGPFHGRRVSPCEPVWARVGPCETGRQPLCCPVLETAFSSLPKTASVQELF